MCSRNVDTLKGDLKVHGHFAHTNIEHVEVGTNAHSNGRHILWKLSYFTRACH